MNTKRHSTDYKLNAVKYYLNHNNTSLSHTCEIFSCEKSSLGRWLNRYLKYETVENKRRKEGSYKVTKEHVNFIMKLINKKPDIFLWQILEQLNDIHKIVLSKSHLINIIKYLNLTYKKFYQNHNPKTKYGKEVEYKKEFTNFYNKVKQYKLKDIICVDETSIQVGIGNSKGRILMGKRLYKNTTSNDIFKKYTLIVAINNNGTVKWELYRDKGIDTNRFEIFLSEILKNKKDKLVIMDNASSHRNNRIKEMITKTGNDYLHIIPYKHYLNCIENYFNQLKYYIRQKEPMNYDKIKESIEYAIKNISKESYKNYFYNTYDKTKLINKYKGTNRQHKKAKSYKD